MKYSTLLVGLSLVCCTPALQTLAHAAPMMQVATDNVVKLPVSTDPSLEFIPLSSLDLSKMENGWKSPQRNKSIEGNPIRLGNTTYESGVGVHAPSRIVVKLNGAVTTFRAVGGIDAEVEHPNNPRDKAAILDYRVLLRGQDGQDQVSKVVLWIATLPLFSSILTCAMQNI